jgi:hypothetical protein
VFFPLTDDTGIWGVTVQLGDAADLCADAQALRTRRNATYVDLHVFRWTGETGWSFLSPDKGTYTVVDRSAPPPLNYAWPNFWKSDANCYNVVAESRAWGQSGTVDVESIAFTSDGTMTGKFDITFGTQNDRVTGSFNASHCVPPASDALYNCE